jgi:hypothetical protein
MMGMFQKPELDTVAQRVQDVVLDMMQAAA